MEKGLGELIRTARLRRGWTQDQLADTLGVQRSYVSQWETGGRKWPQDHVRAIAETLGLSQVEMAVAAGLIDDPRDAPPVDVVPPDSERATVLALVPGLREAEAEVIRATIQAIVKARGAAEVGERGERASNGV